ncbi:MAG: aspartate kinase [Bacteroidales bacterium]|jgi:aspartate kinase|nr:aspartate kinase [Bacteroidales bacterium]
MQIHVEKFGGASINSAKAIRNVVDILNAEPKKRVVVVSAMGKTTNALEKLVKARFEKRGVDTKTLNWLKDYHFGIIDELFGDSASMIKGYVCSIFDRIETQLLSDNGEAYDKFYDTVVSCGEELSSRIISAYLSYKSVEHKFLWAFDFIQTDDCFRQANVDWEQSEALINQYVAVALQNYDLVLTQGYIGGTDDGQTKTTLGREGSDYTAAILSYCLNAVDCTIWKDVEGLLNADPKRMATTTKLNAIPYQEAIELAYYGATIIHPKTIKPLENRSIPLYVKSFSNPQQSGSCICHCDDMSPLVPSYIFKDNQVLLSLLPRDFSFIAEQNISAIFAILAQHNVKVNLMQNSAISLSVCFDDCEVLKPLIKSLQVYYKVHYNRNLQLITVRHYSEQAISEVVSEPLIMVEQRSRVTAQFLVRTE